MERIKNSINRQIKLIKKQLEENNDYLINECNHLEENEIRYYKGENTKTLSHLSIEIFEDDYHFCLYPMDKNNNQIGDYQKILDKCNFDTFSLLESLYDFENEEISKLFDNFFGVISNLFMEWFINGFNKSNLSESKIKYKINFHDDYNEINLN